MGGLFPRASNAVHAVRVVKGGGRRGIEQGAGSRGWTWGFLDGYDTVVYLSTMCRSNWNRLILYLHIYVLTTVVPETPSPHGLVQFLQGRRRGRVSCLLVWLEDVW